MISKELFMALINHHIGNIYDNDDWIREQLTNKIEKMSERELYTRYKTADTEEKREAARIKYIEKKGIHEDFRW